MKMLEELLRGVPTLSVEGSLLREVSGIACDSRRVVLTMQECSKRSNVELALF